MKSIGLYLVLVCFCITSRNVYSRSISEIKMWFMQLGTECNTFHDLSPDDMQALMDFKVPDKENVKCLLACTYKNSTMMNSEGMFDEEASDNMAEKEHFGNEVMLNQTRELFGHCKKVNDEPVTDDKGCDRAALLTRCFLDNAPKYGLKIH